MRHSTSSWCVVTSMICAGLLGCDASPFRTEQPNGDPVRDQPPPAILRQSDLRLGGTQFRHQVAGPALAFSLDGRTIFSGGSDGSVREWDVSTGELRRVLAERLDEVRALALAPGGRVLATGEKNGTVRLSDLATNKELWRSKAHTREITSLVFADDGKVLVSTGYDSTARVLDSATGREVHRLWTYEGGSVWAAVSPDGKSVATYGLDYILHVWKVSDWSEIKKIRPWAIAECLCISPDGRLVVAAGGSERSSIVDLETGQECPQSPSIERDVINAVAFSPNGTELVTGGYNRVMVWDVATGKPVRELEGICGSTKAVAYSRDGKYLAIGGDDGVVRLFDGPSGRPLRRPDGHQSWVTDLAVAPDGRTLASGAWDGTVRIWEIPSGKPFRTLSWELSKESWRSTEKVSSISICGNGKLLASSACDGPVRIWDLASGKETASIRRRLGTGAVILTRNGDEVLLGGLDKTFGFWDTKTGKPLRTFDEAGPARHLALSPDGRTFACPGTAKPKTVELRSSQTGAVLEELEVPPDEPTLHVTSDGVFFCFSPDGKTLAVARENMNGEAGHPIGLFDVATAKAVRAFGYRVRVTALAYSPDGKTVAAACADGKIGIWDTATGDCKEYFGTGQWRVHSLVFSRDGRWIFSGGEDGTVCGWRLGNMS